MLDMEAVVSTTSTTLFCFVSLVTFGRKCPRAYEKSAMVMVEGFGSGR